MAKGIELTVTQLHNYLNNALRNDALLRSLSVRGEISNFHRHSSGHLYFSLKDEGAVVRCVMFRQYATLLRFSPENGGKVVAEGYLSVYARDGQLQLYCESMQPDGVGDLYMRFERTKQRLQAEGLFDAARKQPLPALPRAVGVVTSPTGAAVQDILRVAGRRHPGLRLVISPARVQGEGAAEEIAAAIQRAASVPDVDVILCGRGGGSIEDLWAFNEEVVARAIASCPVPVVSCVGHETDFTIADFAADVRAATPSNAAEIAVPEALGLYERRLRAAQRMQRAMERQLAQAEARFARLRDSYPLARPAAMLEPARNRWNAARAALRQNMERHLERANQRYDVAKAGLRALNPTAVLERGYAILFTADGRAVRSADGVLPGESFRAQLTDGSFAARREG